jgi:Immunoglobulin domain/Immunoglobulin I-set domain
LSARFSEDYPGVITLREATIEDTGSYECKATNVAGTVTLSTTVDVQQAPTITLQPDRQTIDLTEGDELRFSCAATGIPQPTIQIKVPDGSNIRPAPSSASYDGRAEASIAHFNIQRSQGGLYECVANNEAGQDLRYIQVNVNEKRGDVGM